MMLYKGMDLGYGFLYSGYGFQVKRSMMLSKGMDSGYGFIDGGMDFNETECHSVRGYGSRPGF